VGKLCRKEVLLAFDGSLIDDSALEKAHAASRKHTLSEDEAFELQPALHCLLLVLSESQLLASVSNAEMKHTAPRHQSTTQTFQHHALLLSNL
jgi:hypothetical protein